VYLRIDKDVRQPFRKTLNLEQSVEEINAGAERLLAEDGPRYQPVAWTPALDGVTATWPARALVRVSPRPTGGSNSSSGSAWRTRFRSARAAAAS
jgi:hypothetical protein